MKVNHTTALLYDMNCASWPVLPAPQGDADHGHSIMKYTRCHVSDSKLRHIRRFLFFFLNVELTIMLYCQLNSNLLESFNSHQSVFHIQYTSVPSFPSAWLRSHCWGLAWLAYSTDGNCSACS